EGGGGRGRRGGGARAGIGEPTSEIADAVQYLRNSGSRQRPPKRRRRAAGVRRARSGAGRMDGMKRLTPTQRGGIECPTERLRAQWRKEKGANHGPYWHRSAQEGQPDVHPGRKALTLAAGLGMRPLVAHCHLGLGKLFARTGKREQARESFTTPTTMYRGMDMPFWLERAEVELKRLA